MIKKEKLIVSSTLIVFLLFWFVIPLIDDIKKEKRLKKEGIYTVATVLTLVDDHHSSPAVKYKFKYKGSFYEDFSAISNMDRPIISHRFFVHFLPDAPLTSKILLDKPTTTDIIEIPNKG